MPVDVVSPGDLFRLRLTVSELGGKAWELSRYLQYQSVDVAPADTVTDRVEQFLAQAGDVLRQVLTPASYVSALDAVWQQQNLAVFRVHVHLLGMRLGSRLSAVVPALLSTRCTREGRSGRHQVSGIPSAFVEYQTFTAQALVYYAAVAVAWTRQISWDYQTKRLVPVYIPAPGPISLPIDQLSVRGYTGVYSPRRG